MRPITAEVGQPTSRIEIVGQGDAFDLGTERGATVHAAADGELASLAEDRRDMAEAERQHKAAVALLSANYPNSAALLNTQARLASFYTRSGQTEPALALFKGIVNVAEMPMAESSVDDV